MNEHLRRRYFVLATLAGALLWLALALSVGCAGQRARDVFLMPAMSAVWPSVSEDVQRGIDDAFEDGDLTQDQQELWTAENESFGAAIDAGSREQFAPLAPLWGASLRSFGDRGVQDRVDDGEISTGVAESLTERLDNFTQAVDLAIQRLDN